jgi:hypothetical protein
MYCKRAGNNPEESGMPRMEKIIAKMEEVLIEKFPQKWINL